METPFNGCDVKFLDAEVIGSLVQCRPSLRSYYLGVEIFISNITLTESNSSCYSVYLIKIATNFFLSSSNEDEETSS